MESFLFNPAQLIQPNFSAPRFIDELLQHASPEQIRSNFQGYLVELDKAIDEQLVKEYDELVKVTANLDDINESVAQLSLKTEVRLKELSFLLF
jgi:hypothetical protein